MKKLLRSRYTWLVLSVVLVLGTSLLLAQVFDSDTLVRTFDGKLYKEYKTRTVFSVAELAADFQGQQARWMPLAPPSTEFWGWTQEATPTPLPFDPAGFPKDFVSALIPSYRDGVVVYPVTLWEDLSTRDRVFYNLDNKEIGRLPAPQPYDPRWCVLGLYPGLAKLAAPTDKANWLALVYDPSRLLIRYDLILDDDLIKWVLAKAVRASLRMQQATVGGVMMMQGQGGSTITSVQFTDIQRGANGAVNVTLAYPDQYRTNASTGVEIFTCDGNRGLLDFWWDLGIRTNVNTSTNSIVWTDPGSTDSNATSRFYAAALTNDADGDGFSDGFERFVYHTNPTNASSRPFSVSGTITYTGSLTGPVRMIAVTSSNSWVGCMATMSSPGSYTNSKVANGTSYWFKAYRDCNSNKVRDYGEPWGVYSNVSLMVTNDRTGINITLIEDNDEDADGLPDWWELQYFGSIWTQNGNDDSDGDSLSNFTEFSLGTSPANRDTDQDGLSDSDEVYTYGTNPTVSDTDGDGMGDGTEVANGQDPTNADEYASLTFFESFDVLQDTNVCVASSTNFGYSVAIWSNTFLVGAPGTALAANGRVCFFEWNGTNWICATNILAPAGATNFGVSVALQGNRALVGADQAFGQGRVYVYRRQQGVWTNEAALSASDGTAGDEFGHAVAISGTNLVVGAWKAQGSRGKAYIYTYNGNAWAETQGLTPFGYWSYEVPRYGCAVAIDGDKAFIGATGNGGTWFWWESGRVFCYKQDGANWQYQQTIQASDSYITYGFGNALSVESNTLIVGSSSHDFSTDPWDDQDNNYGAAYVYSFNGTIWTNEQLLSARDMQIGNQFGASVALTGNRIVLGSDGADGKGENSGCVYIFENECGAWRQKAKIAPGVITSNSFFGCAGAASADRCLVGAPGVPGDQCIGRTFVFSLTNAVSSGGLEEGDSLAFKDGWTAYPPEQAAVQSGVRFSGSGSLQIEKAYGRTKVYRLIGAHNVTNVWIDCWARLSPTNSAMRVEHPDIASFPSWLPSVFAVNGDGHLTAFDGSSCSAWIVASNTTISAGTFHRYTVRQDYVEKSWDLYLCRRAG